MNQFRNIKKSVIRIQIGSVSVTLLIRIPNTDPDTHNKYTGTYRAICLCFMVWDILDSFLLLKAKRRLD